jgi:hypothetical protein
MDRDKLKAHVESLVVEGTHVFIQEVLIKRPELLDGKFKDFKKKNKSTLQLYQSWYTKVIPILRQLAPERLKEFVDLYLPDPKRKNADYLRYTITDYLNGTVHYVGGEKSFEPFDRFVTKIQHQIAILDSIHETIDLRLSDIEGVVQADLFRHELEAAADLHKKKHHRAAGALAGVTIESHLSRVCTARDVIISKKTPSIAEYNNALKEAGVIDTPTWRLIQRLGDIRNLCVHAKEREPTDTEIQDLLAGAGKLIAELL